MLKQFADKFRITRDQVGDPLIRCAGGFVYEYSAKTLGVWLDSEKPNRSFNAVQRRWPKAELRQVGEGEFTFVFTPSGRAEAERFLRSQGAHRRRMYDEATMAKMREQAARARQFKIAVIP